MRSFWAALSFLTRIPVPIRPTGGDWIRGTLFYPVVGLIIGLILSLFDWGIARHFPSLVRSVLDLSLWVFLTGGLHLDGLMDTADGFGAHRNRSQTLAVMKDSRVGAMGALAAILLLMLKGSALASFQKEMWIPLIVAPVAGRMAVLLGIFSFPYAREQGIGTGMQRGLTPIRFIVSFFIGSGIILYITGWKGLLLLAGAGVITGWLAVVAMKRLGGLTGDLYGASVELTEAGVLLLWLWAGSH